MKFIKINILAALLITLIFSMKAEAKWWIFGQSNEEVSVNYLYLNDISYDESGPKVTVYRETLKDSLLYIKGKASVKKGKIGSVRVTVDNKENWQEAKISENGVFEFSFKPEQGKLYTLYVEIMDTAGKMNNVEETRKEVTLSDQNIMAAIREVLDRMVEAYRNEDAARFMVNVSEDFVNDDAVLDGAIRRDFSAFDNIDLRYTINNVASGAKGIYVSINYNRMVISSRNGQSFSDRGVTEFVFKFGEDGPRVYSMKAPLIFGLCESSSVSNGVLRTAYSEKVLICDEKGNVSLVTFQEAINGNFGEEGAGALQTKSMTLQSRGFGDFDGIIFSEDEKTLETGFFIVGDLALFEGGFQFRLNANIMGARDLGVRSLDSIREAPTGMIPEQFLIATEGHAYALQLGNGKYVIMELVSLNQSGLGTATAMIRYKYQPNGSRNF